MIEIKDISAGYGKKEVLSHLSVSFEKGKLTGIIGTNGCGKSTLLKTVLGILPQTSGNIFIDEKNISNMKRNHIAKHLSYLAQGKNTPDMTVEQMVLHGRFPHLSYPRRYTKSDKEIAHSAMEQMKINELAHLPLSALSGGMRQNAYIAMALAQDTDYILLDEPTTYLDITHQVGLIKTLQVLTKSGKGVVCVMHDLPLALTFSDEIVVMRNGKIAINGTPQEIYASGIIEELFGISIKLTDGGNYCYIY